VAANADRRLPFADDAFRLVTSVTARHNPTEFRRVLAADGHLLVVVPDDDDLAELRAAVLGDARPLGAVARVRERITGFSLLADESVRGRPTLPPEALRDLFGSTYRGNRRGQAERLAALPEGPVTIAQRLLLLR
jgi:23S rRNA (guanine745-N1)-methyltransferase